MRFLFFNTETTGKLEDRPHVVQLAAMLTERGPVPTVSDQKFQ
jgi:hypothetical protein